MMHLPPDFKELLRLLNLKKVDYLVVGGYAVAFHGYPRATGDIDIWIAISKNNSLKTVDVLKKFGFNVPSLNAGLFLKKGKNIRLGNPPLRVEILTSIEGVKFEECYEKKRRVAIDGIRINFISLSDLKKNKKASGRLQDLADIENLS